MADLGTRDGLPDALRVLLEHYPRSGWEMHPNFDGLTRFWLDRHLMFREILGRLRASSEGFLDGQTDARAHALGVQRMGGFFLNELHTHHHVEDNHYFPKIQPLEARLDHGFTLLDADHHVLEAHIHGTAELMNACLQADGKTAERKTAGALLDQLLLFERFMECHLTDEEDLIVPVILKHAPALG